MELSNNKRIHETISSEKDELEVIQTKRTKLGEEYSEVLERERSLEKKIKKNETETRKNLRSFYKKTKNKLKRTIKNGTNTIVVMDEDRKMTKLKFKWEKDGKFTKSWLHECKNFGPSMGICYPHCIDCGTKYNDHIVDLDFFLEHLDKFPIEFRKGTYTISRDMCRWSTVLGGLCSSIEEKDFVAGVFKFY